VVTPILELSPATVRRAVTSPNFHSCVDLLSSNAIFVLPPFSHFILLTLWQELWLPVYFTVLLATLYAQRRLKHQGEQTGIWKEADVPGFNVPSRHSSQKTEKAHRQSWQPVTSQYCRYCYRDSLNSRTLSDLADPLSCTYIATSLIINKMSGLLFG
jgi:hypothetical protein